MRHCYVSIVDIMRLIEVHGAGDQVIMLMILGFVLVQMAILSNQHLGSSKIILQLWIHHHHLLIVHHVVGRNLLLLLHLIKLLQLLLD